MRKLAHIEEIVDIKPIEGADRIEIATVLGWQVVVKKGEFKVGDKVCYIEIDSIVPEKPEFEFLRDRKFKVKTIKLRKQISQGLIVPLTTLPKNKYNVGDDVTNELGIKQFISDGEKEGRGIATRKPKTKLTKYMMKYEWFRNLYNKKYKPQSKKFPEWIFKTDENRLQNIPDILKDKSQKYYSTIKMDGSSLTLAVKDKEFVICSRNVRLSDKKNSDSNFVKLAHQINYKEVLTKIKKSFNAKSVIIQGEMCGTGIQGNKYDITGLNLFVFNLIIDNKKYPTYEIRKIFEENQIALMTVPLVTENVKGDCLYILPDTIEEMLERAKGDSLYYSTIREGIVVRSEDQSISFKVINNEFLLKEKD